MLPHADFVSMIGDLDYQQRLREAESERIAASALASARPPLTIASPAAWRAPSWLSRALRWRSAKLWKRADLHEQAEIVTDGPDFSDLPVLKTVDVGPSSRHIHASSRPASPLLPARHRWRSSGSSCQTVGIEEIA